MAAVTITALEPVREPTRARVLLQPLRTEILSLMRTPRSATEVAEQLGLARQKVNYHVRALGAAAFLEKAGRRRKRNLYEQLWVASARSFVLLPELLGALGADPSQIEDRWGAAHLLALASRMQSDVARAGNEPIATLSLDAELRFTSAEQRARFAQALTEAVAKVLAEHASPAIDPAGKPGPGEPYRLALGCYPVVNDTSGDSA